MIKTKHLFYRIATAIFGVLFVLSSQTALAAGQFLQVNVTLDSSSPSTKLILGSSTGVPISTFKFVALNEDAFVQRLSLRSKGLDAIATAVHIEYEDQRNVTKTKTGFLANGVVTFDRLDFFVPMNASRTLVVKIDTNSVGPGTVQSGNHFQLDFSNGGFEAVGGTWGIPIGPSSVTNRVIGNTMVLRKTKPTISLAAGSPSGAGVPGLGEALRFNVSADSRGFVQLRSLTFKVNADARTSGWEQCDGGADIGSGAKWDVYDIQDPTTMFDDNHDWIFLTTDGSTCRRASGDVLKYAKLNFGNDHVPPPIGAGETKTYVVRLDTTGASPVNDSIRIDIPDETEMNALAVKRSALSWDDDTAVQNIGGAFIRNLPVTGGKITF